jgi:hypothetical protein
MRATYFETASGLRDRHIREVVGDHTRKGG